MSHIFEIGEGHSQTPDFSSAGFYALADCHVARCTEIGGKVTSKVAISV